MSLSSQFWLEARGLTKQFKAVKALDDVSVGFEGPGIVGLIGPNGSGKSTLLGALSGLIVPSQGDVYVGSQRMTGRPAYRYAGSGVSRTFQQVRLVPGLRTWENIAAGLPTRAGTNELRGRVLKVADSLGITHCLDEWPADLPMGIQRRVQVASAVIAEPRIVLLDEPAAGLTEREAAELVGTIRPIAETALVVIVEHNMQLIYSAATRVVVLMSGALVADGTPEDVTSQRHVQEAYLGVE